LNFSNNNQTALMRTPQNLLVSILLASVIGAVFAESLPSTPSGYWPGWRGADRSNRSAETGLLSTWPPEGPPLLWTTVGLGHGIASVSVANGTVYTAGYSEGREYVYALNADTGESRWTTGVGPEVRESSLMRWLSQRTPTIDEDRLYTVTAWGELFCLSTADGSKLWHKSYPNDFASPKPTWGFSDRPLVDGEKLICIPVGPKATVVALNKRTGEVVWTSLVSAEERESYAATVISTAGGVRQYLVSLAGGLVGIAADDGRVLWRYTKTHRRTGNSYTPIPHGDFVFSLNGYGGGMALVKIARDADTLRAEEQYHHGFDFNPFQDSSVLVDDHVYSFRRPGQPVCIDLKTGEPAWGPIATEAQDRVALTYAEGHLYVRRASGLMVLQKATPEAYIEISSFRIPDPEEASGATAPVVAGRRLYLRDNRRLLCYDLAADARKKPAAAPRIANVSLVPAQVADAESPRPSVAAQPDAIYVPTPDDVVAAMLKLADVTARDVVYDLGSGDGRIVLAAARDYGATAVGYETDSELVEQSRGLARDHQLEGLVTIHPTDLFAADLSAVDVIAVYLPTELMTRLLPQFQKLKPGARIVSHQFRIPGFPPHRTLTVVSAEDGEPHRVYLWTAPLEGEAPPQKLRIP
jgi:outer membrane protein assembly factor BamB